MDRREIGLTGSGLEPWEVFGFSNGTTEDADGSVSEPRFVFSGCQHRQSLVAAFLPDRVCVALVVNRHS